MRYFVEGKRNSNKIRFWIGSILNTTYFCEKMQISVYNNDILVYNIKTYKKERSNFDGGRIRIKSINAS